MSISLQRSFVWWFGLVWRRVQATQRAGVLSTGVLHRGWYEEDRAPSLPDVALKEPAGARACYHTRQTAPQQPRQGLRQICSLSFFFLLFVPGL